MILPLCNSAAKNAVCETVQIGMPAPKGGNVTSFKKGGPPGPSRQSLILKDALLLAAQTAGGGGPDGLHNYLAKQAEANPTAFMAMLSRVIPLQQSGSGDGKTIVEIVKHFESEERVTLIEHGPTNGEEG